MLRFVFQKMLAMKWLTACLLIGNVFLCSISAAIPIYTDATMNRVLQRQLNDCRLENGRDAGVVEVEIGVRMVDVSDALGEIEETVTGFAEDMGLDILARVDSIASDVAEIQNMDGRETSAVRKLRMYGYDGASEHLEIISGRMPEGYDEDGAIEVAVNQRTMIRQDLVVGDYIQFRSLRGLDDSLIRARVVGVCRAIPDERYWNGDPELLEDFAYTDVELLRELYTEDFSVRRPFLRRWYLLLDTTQMDVREASGYVEALDRLHSVSRFSRSAIIQADFEDVVRSQGAVHRKLVQTMLILLVPVMLLLVFFIFMVSKQTLEQEKNTISVLDSRGASRKQILGIFTMQSVLLAVTAAVLGIPLGILICRVFGSASGYMELVRRAAMPVRLRWDTFLYVGAAVLVSVGTMVIPAALYANVSVVEAKQHEKHGESLKSLLPRLAADLGLLAVALYGRYAFRNQMAALAADGAEASVDPLVFLASSLFLLSIGLLVSLLVPQVVRLIHILGRRNWSPAAYSAFLRVTRASGNQRPVMIFLILTVAIGVFNARTARTLDRNMTDNIYHENGADLVLQQVWKDNNNRIVEASGPSTSSTQNTSKTYVIYQDPDESPWQDMLREHPEITMTHVLNGRKYGIGTQSGVHVMGIVTTEFAAVARMRGDLLPIHWYHYLNALSSDPSAILMSRNWHDDLGYELGQRVVVRNENDVYFSAVIYGFVDYWPGYTGTVDKMAPDGTVTQIPDYLVVGNLRQMQADWGIAPWELWFSAEDAAPIYECIEENGLQLTRLSDSAEEIRAAMRDPVLQGVNGFLTVSFLLVLLVCITGYLIFWILSIRARQLQVGSYRAMGMSLRELTGMLLIEQICVSVTSAAAGFAAGWAASELYVQLVQLSFSGEFSLLPLHVASAGGDVTAVAAVIVAAFLACMIMLREHVRRIPMIQAINRGEN